QLEPDLRLCPGFLEPGRYRAPARRPESISDGVLDHGGDRRGRVLRMLARARAVALGGGSAERGPGIRDYLVAVRRRLEAGRRTAERAGRGVDHDRWAADQHPGRGGCVWTCLRGIGGRGLGAGFGLGRLARRVGPQPRGPQPNSGLPVGRRTSPELVFLVAIRHAATRRPRRRPGGPDFRLPDDRSRRPRAVSWRWVQRHLVSLPRLVPAFGRLG